MYIVCFAYLLIYWRTLGLLPPFGYCEWCCYEHKCTSICLSPCFQLFGVYIRSGIARSYGHSMFSTVAVPVYIPINDAPGFQFLYIFANTCYFFVFLISHHDGYEVVSHWGFDSHFPKDEWYWTSFPVLIGHLYIFFGEMSIHVFCPFLKWVVWLFSFSVEL